MKSKVIGAYVSLVLMFFACGIIICFHLWSICISNALINIGYGILGSSVVTLVITYSEYFIEKKKNLETFLLSIYDCLHVISKIDYLEIDQEKRIVADFNYLNIFPVLTEEQQKIVDRKLEEYKKYFISCKAINENISNEQFIEFLKQKDNQLQKEIRETIQSYIVFGEYSMNKVDSSYNDIYFIRFKKGKEKKDILYEQFYSKLYRIHRKVEIESGHFKKYLEGEITNIPVILDKINELNEEFFKIESFSNETIVWGALVDSVFDDLEIFRCEIYKQKYEERKKYPKKITIRNNGIQLEKKEQKDKCKE